MQKYGLFDPGSLRRGERGFVIDFISAVDTSDIEEVRVESSTEAERIIAQLQAQKNSVETPFLALGRETVRMKGAIMMMADKPGKGMIATHDASGKKQVFSLQTVFDLDPKDMPEEGIGFANGYLEEGTLYAHQIAMKTLQPAGAAPQPNARMTESI